MKDLPNNHELKKISLENKIDPFQNSSSENYKKISLRKALSPSQCQEIDCITDIFEAIYLILLVS